MQYHVYNAIITTTTNAATITANAAATIANTYIATILISNRMLIIRCDDVYNAAPANVRSWDAVNVYNSTATSATATATATNVMMFIMLLVLI